MSENMEDEIVNILSKNYHKIADISPKCDRCSKTVYVVEELKIDNKTFHKVCFKCASCNKTLDKSKYTEHENNYFCQNCYSKYFGPNSNLMSYTEEKTESNNQSNDDNYNDESNSFFKIVLKKPSSNFSNQTNNEFTNGYDQKSKWVKDYFKHSAIGGQKKSEEKVVLIQSNNCHRCHKPVYAVEELRAMNNVYHKFCFKCNTCKKLLETGTSTEHQGLPYCRNCYSKNFGPKVYANDDRPEAIAYRHELESNETFNHSALRVQQVKSAFSPYKQKEEVYTPNETIETNVSTKDLINSYSKLINETQVQNQVKKQPTRTVKYMFENKNTSNTQSFEKETSNTNIKNLKSALKKTQSSNLIVEDSFSRIGFNSQTKSVRKFGSSDKCTRCGQSVFAAEKQLGGKNVFHTVCFKCCSCSKALNLTNYLEHNNEIFCKYSFREACLNWNSVQVKI